MGLTVSHCVSVRVPVSQCVSLCLSVSVCLRVSPCVSLVSMGLSVSHCVSVRLGVSVCLMRLRVSQCDSLCLSNRFLWRRRKIEDYEFSLCSPSLRENLRGQVSRGKNHFITQNMVEMLEILLWSKNDLTGQVHWS